MRTDDSFYQETYINANVNGVRPYWKNVKVRVGFYWCSLFRVFFLHGGGRRKKNSPKKHPNFK